MATSLWIWQAGPRRDDDGLLQNHHPPASFGPGSAPTTDRSHNRLQRPQQNDQAGYADLRPYQIRRKSEEEMQPKPYSCTNAIERRKVMARIFITGSTDGLGRAAARSLIDDGHQVVLH